MHSSEELTSDMFAYAIAGRPAGLTDVLADFGPRDRLGIVSRTPGGALTQDFSTTERVIMRATRLSSTNSTVRLVMVLLRQVPRDLTNLCLTPCRAARVKSSSRLSAGEQK